MSFSNSTPHFGQDVASSGMNAPHSPHSTILPRPYTFQYTVIPATTATAAPRMTRKSHHGTPRIGTGLLRNGRVFFTVIDWVCGPMRPDEGVTTTSQGPSRSPYGPPLPPRE